MTEVSGDGYPATVYEQTIRNKGRNSDQRLGEKNSAVSVEDLKGVEVILSSDQESSKFDTYENLNKSIPPRLSSTERRAIDDLEYEQSNYSRPKLGGTDMGDSKKWTLDSLL